MSARQTWPVLAEGGWRVLDTETTGVGPYDQVIEVAVLDDEGRVLLDSLARPERPISAKAAAVHGINDEAVAQAPTWPQVWHRLAPLITEKPTLAWNAAFDIRLLRQTCDRHQLPFQGQSFACLKQIFQKRHPLLRGSLAAACLALGLPQRPKHRAKSDAELARRVAWCLAESQE